MRKTGISHPLGLLLVVFLAATLAACGSGINQANFDKIEEGMSLDQVKAILGAPADTSSIRVGGISGSSVKWSDKNGVITVQFINGKVQAKTFTRAPQG